MPEGGGIFTAAFYLSFTFSAEEVIGAKSVFFSHPPIEQLKRMFSYPYPADLLQ
jgi:hypothetical protein